MAGGDYPKTLYRGSFANKADLEAAWNSQGGIEQKHVNSVQEQEAALSAGFVEQPIDMVKMPTAASMMPTKKGPRDEPLSGNR